MQKVQRIGQNSHGIGPTQCLTCGRGNVPDDPDTMDEFWAIDLDVDVNWGDPCYICKYCVEKLLGIAGYVDLEELEALERNHKALRKELHDTKAELEDKTKRVKVLVAAEGVKETERKKDKVA